MNKLFLASSCSFLLALATAACSDDSRERAAPGIDGPPAASQGREAGDTGQQHGSGTADDRAAEHERPQSDDDERIDEQVEDSYSGSTATEAGGSGGRDADTGTSSGSTVVHPKEP
ncbi:hypothetical protein [Pusillimonas noertemannii]|uniref:hypothetical protein n=1 Tax=Pusillimonas noertemannii TaxID=305977 RepID=UPI003342255A